MNEAIVNKLETLNNARETYNLWEHESAKLNIARGKRTKLDPQAAISSEKAQVSNSLLRTKDGQQNLQAKKEPGQINHEQFSQGALTHYSAELSLALTHIKAAKMDEKLLTRYAISYG